ncbi:MAG: hypothetical protein CSA21_04275 [Deltaproteobacteria bacterium]|nr:MAG: hypothetical protein CSA21_04275 [Deltaproteobacteria bacterium]
MSNFLSQESLSGDPKDPPEHIADASGISDTFHDNELESLRQMLFARELALLEEVARNQEAKKFNIERVSDVLAESIILRAEKDRQLNIALEPVVDDILKASLNRRKNDFVNLLFPLIGPVVRKSITETFFSMLGNVSQSLEVAFSWRGLQWRFESWRSGKPFNEIVLLHTVVYRVEQVFFIHSETGLLLSHVVSEEVPVQDADMVSAMLTAIQDFVKDSFSGSQDDSLHSLRIGDISLIIEKNDVAYVACVVRGTLPANFRIFLQDSFDMMLVKYAKPLADFSGDTAPFVTAVRYLEPLLLSRHAEEERAIPLWAKIIPVVCLFVILCWGGYVGYTTFTRNALLKDAVLSLKGYPGIIVTNVTEHTDRPWEVLTFKDALAPQPEDILQSKGFSSALLDFKTVPFISYDVSIIVRRVKNAISPPDTVSIALNQNGTLVLSGTAPMNWILHARDVAKSLPGIKHVDVSGLYDPLLEQVMGLVENINRTCIQFPLGKAVPVGNELVKLEEAIDNLVQLENIARKNNLAVSLSIYGHADSVGSEKRNYEVSQARAKTVAAGLYARGSSILISLYGMGSTFSKSCSLEKVHLGDQASRKIELRVSLSRAVSADSFFESK